MAVNEMGSSSESAVSNSVNMNTGPGEPTDLVLSVNEQTSQITLSWTAPVYGANDVQSYKIYFHAKENQDWFMLAQDILTTTYTFLKERPDS